MSRQARRSILSAAALSLAAGCTGAGTTPEAHVAPNAAVAPQAASRDVAEPVAPKWGGHPADPLIGAAIVRANVGINVEGVVDYAISQQYVDAIRQSRPWGSPSAPYDQAVAQAGEIDANGWPTVDAGVLALCCVTSDGSSSDPGAASQLAGTYQLSFNGSATVGSPISGGTVSGYAYDAVTNLSTATVTFSSANASGGIYLNFTNSKRTASSAAGTGITNVKLIRPQYAPNGSAWWTSPTQTFTSPFLASLQGYTTLRFMDWTATNGSPVVNWSDRTTGAYATAQRQIPYNGSFAPTGASWEDAIALANATNEDMWINVPAMATDDYVRQLATLIHSSLHSGLHVYVEYSNEVWNGSFAQFQYNLNLAEDEAQSNPYYKSACSPSDQYRWGQCRVAERLEQIASDFASSYGKDAIGTTVRPVLATQEDATYYLGGALPFVAAQFGPPSSYFYAIAEAPYWEGDQSQTGQTDVQELQAAESNLQSTLPKSTTDFTAYAIAYGLRNFTYEGGPGMYGTASLAAKVAANLEPAIGAQVTEGLGDFFADGGDMFVYYNDASAYGQYGMWGTTDDILDPTEPKYTAIHAVAGTSHARTAGTNVPGTVSGTVSQIEFSGGGYSQPSYFYYRNGEAQGFLVNAQSAGAYALTLTTGSYTTTPANVTVSVNGTMQGTLATVPTAGNPDNQATSLPLTVNLRAGLAIVEIAETSGEFALYSVNLTKTGTSPIVKWGKPIR